jgi:hypothetical protein
VASPLWAAVGGVGASFLASAFVFALILPITTVDFAPVSRERAFEWSWLVGSAAAVAVAQIAGGWRAVGIVAVYLVATLSYAIFRSMQTYDACLQMLGCVFMDVPTSRLDAVFRQWPTAAGAALGFLASSRVGPLWRSGKGTNATLEATGAFVITAGAIAAASGFADARGGPIALLTETSEPRFIALFVASLAVTAVVIGLRSRQPLSSGARFMVVAIAVVAPFVVEYSFARGPRELRGAALLTAIPVAATAGVALFATATARLVRALGHGTTISE